MTNLDFRRIGHTIIVAVLFVCLSPRALAFYANNTDAFYVKDEKDHGCLKDATNTRQLCRKCAEGAPIWWVSEPYLNLWLADEPAAYRTSLGKEITFRLTYKQRDVRSTWHSYIPLTGGTGWSHNWFSYVHFRDASGGIGTQFALYDAVLYLEGGEYNFSSGSVTEPSTGLQLSPLDGISTDIYPTTNTLKNVYGKVGCRVTYPDGSQDIYGYITQLYPETVVGPPRYTNIYSSFDALLSERVDPLGNTIRFYYTNYSGGYVLQYVVDYDNRTNTLSYTNAMGNPFLLSRVDMPYGRSVNFYYTNNFLGSVSNAETNTTYFQYAFFDTYSTNSFYYLSGMYLPYSSNWLQFSYTNSDSPMLADGTEIGTAGGTNRINRSITITLQDGSQEVYAYRFDSSEVGVPDVLQGAPTNTYYGTLDDGSVGTDTVCSNYFRNSFHWDRQQYSAVVGLGHNNIYQFTAADYAYASRKHWLCQTNFEGFINAGTYSGKYQLCPDISSSQEASPSGSLSNPGQITWYDYLGKSTQDPWMLGAAISLNDVARRLPDSTTWYDHTDYDPASNLPVTDTSTYSPPSGGFGTRSTTLNYTYVPGVEICSTNGVYDQSSNTWNVPFLAGITGPGGTALLTVTGAVSYVTNGFSLTSNGVLYVYTRSFPIRKQVGLIDGVGDPSILFVNGRGQITGLDRANGLLTTNVYGYDNFLAESANMDSGLHPIATNYYSFSGGLLSGWTNELGLPRTFTWDNLQRLTSIAFPLAAGSYISNMYPVLDLTWHRDRLGHVSTAAYDSLEELVGVTDNRGKQTTLSYCSCGALATIFDPLTNVTSLTRDLNGRVTGISYSGTGQRNLLRNTLGQVINLNDASGLSMTFHYNNQGLLTNASTTNGPIFQAVYDIYDRPITNVTAEGVVITNSYDLLGRPLTRGFPNMGFEQFVYSTNGLSTYYDPQGNPTRFYYDLAGRLTAVTNANGEATKFGYDGAGHVVALTNGLGKATTWAYDVYGQQIAETNANGVLVLTNGYDFNGNLTARWTLAKGLATFVYDQNGNLTNAIYPGFSISYAFDALNRLQSLNDSLGSIAFTYANFGAFSGALATESGPWASDTRTYSYANALLQSLSLSQPSGSWSESFVPDGELRLQSVTTPDGTFSNTYYGAGGLVRRISFPGGGYITNDFDGDGMLLDTWLKSSAGSILNHHGYNYDLAFNRTNATRADASHLSYTYDAIGQLIKAVGYDTAGTGAPRLNEAFGYGYDRGGNLNFRTNGVLTETFSVDSLNQLSTITRSGSLTAAGMLNMSPQANSLLINGVGAAIYGDLAFATTNGLSLVNGSNAFTTTLKNSSGQTLTQTRSANLPSSVSLYYDFDGNLTNDGLRTFEYDGADRLTAVTVSNAWRSEYSYDGLWRRRITKQYGWSGGSWGTTTNEVHYVYDRGLVIQERNSVNQPLVTITRGVDLSGSFQGAGGIGGLLARTDANGPAFYHADGAGNITMLVNSSGVVEAKYLYDAFGNPLGSTGNLAAANLYRVSGKQLDNLTGDYYYGFRFFDPNLQRWSNKDPSGLKGGLNLHAWVGNNPVSYIDPYGLNWLGDYMNQVGQGLYDMMMGDETGRYNPNSKGAIEAAMGMGLDRNDNVLRDSMGEAASLIGAGAQVAAEQYAAGVIGGALGEAAGKIACKAAKSITQGLNDALSSAGDGGMNALTDVAEGTVGKTIGLGLDEDLMNLRGTGAITYKNAGWQQAGLTTVDAGRATEASWFRMSFNEASQNAGAIRFDVSSFDLAYPKPGMTSWELNQVVNNPSLLGKTTFIQNGQQVIWNGTGFVKP